MKSLFKEKRVAYFYLFFSLTMVFCLGVTALYTQSRTQLERSQMEQIAMSRSEKVTDVLTKLLYKTHVLSALVVQSDGDVAEFERVAATILDEPCIKNLILAPDGVVRYVYPLTGNEAVLGLDFFSEGLGNQEAVYAKETGQLVLGGPFTLVQGDQALVGRLPIYTGAQKDHFWGLASVTLNYPQALLGAELDQLQLQGFAYEIWRINPDSGQRQIIANSSYAYHADSRYVEYQMDILNAEWYFRLSPIRLWYEFPETWIFIGAGMLLSLLIGLLMMHNCDLNAMKEQFESLSLIDPLTGIMNRRGGFRALHSMKERQTSFVLAFLDLDGFKNVNDKCGHNTGDHFLQMFSAAVKETFSASPHTFARVGGDEFMIIFEGMTEIAQVQAWFQTLEERLARGPMLCREKKIPIRFSVGFVCCPTDGTDLDELIALADDRMYREKKRRQN